MLVIVSQMPPHHRGCFDHTMQLICLKFRQIDVVAAEYSPRTGPNC
ncbi:unnamed protein product [Gemmata massiliana]|uniref:Uncharacterized protein n=1 Tax=Gemmata massiliana TaxID=1210884 RepID=A0A6P2DLP9_9BACT|nr:unnamed protein product [Gemmata massiliana]